MLDEMQIELARFRQDALLTSPSTEWAEEAVISRDRWERLTNRIIEASAAGLSMALLSRETGVDGWWIDIFMSKPNTVSGVISSGYTERSRIENRVAALETYLTEYEAAQRKKAAPIRIETTITEAVKKWVDAARDLIDIRLIDKPSGVGGTEAWREYRHRARLSEGYACPVWAIELDQYTIGHKPILQQIAAQVGVRNFESFDIPTLRNKIRDTAEGRGGVLIVDEAQHLADTDQKQGLAILNGLRSFADGRYFGIVFIGNGEIYRRLTAGKFTQLISRMEQLEIFGLSDSPSKGRICLQTVDVRNIADAWGVIDTDGIGLSVAIAKQDGALRKLTKIYAKALRDYNEISYDSMIAAGANP